MKHYLILGGFDSRDFDMVVGSSAAYAAPARIVEKFTVPGRNGMLTVESGAFENVKRSYSAALLNQDAPDFSFEGIRAKLLGANGYQRLEDSYSPSTYMMARLSTGFEISKQTASGRDYKFKLSFDCKPQRFLKLGEVPILQPVSVYNPTAFPAKPILRFVMSATSGSLTIGDCAITVSGATAGDTFIIDAETTDAVDAVGSNMNPYVTVSGEITLQGNTETAIASTGMSDLQITPRWWTI